MDKITIERETLERAIAEVNYLQSQPRLANEHTQNTLDALRAALAAQPAPAAVPLTDEQIRDLWSWSATLDAEYTANTQQHAFARAIERAHGIAAAGDKP